MATRSSARLLSRLQPARCLNAAARRPVPRPTSTFLRTAPRSSIRYASRYSASEDASTLDATPENPLDPVALHRAEAARRAYYTRRRNFAAIGAVVCMAVPLMIVYNLDLDELKKQTAEKTDSPQTVTDEFQGRNVVLAPGGEKLLAEGKNGKADIELVETGTSSVPVFPKTIKLPSASGDEGEIKATETTDYTLLGLGIRTVSFLSIQVYVVGIYVESSALPRLQAALIKRVNPTASTLITGEKDQLRSSLMSPEESNAIWESLLKDDKLRANMAIRIVPTRETNFPHLRDGLVRGITKRVQEASAIKSEGTDFSDEAFGEAMRDFKGLFNSRGKAPKGSILLLRRDSQGAVEMLFQGGKEGKGPLERLGHVQDERVSRMLWLLYLGGKNVSSEGARKSVVDGCLELVERPIGTVETRVE
ncbi:uncharacterized protein K452DRAFT_360402 [Aplosporella prunicola CBS 121167]|uniref:Chalcone isomerase domain-containing protein n=1 Tax=Aplosporella prunicola CBS 121167 TaxID=1176127 RepID=A0A6A6B9R4_9PEZI|nr:uncharacterized protein K452DRAFT_360402 [Aplosporella prunicola CBS 121167]KAF2139657.1 hypothetical protein K452DRAFT_360402 [Aplosporella prunicola CBS 121167]